MLRYAAPQEHKPIQMKIWQLPLKTRQKQIALLLESYHFLSQLEVSHLMGSHSGMVHQWHPCSTHSQLLPSGIAKHPCGKNQSHKQPHCSRNLNRVIQRKWTASKLKMQSNKLSSVLQMSMGSICILKFQQMIKGMFPL